MSLITHFSVYTHCNDLGGKVWNPAITWTKKYAVFVTIRNQHGITGLGECWCFDTTPDVLVAYLKTEIAPQVVGSTSDECTAVFQRLLSRATLTARHGLLASSWSGVDIALWDMRSREAGLPLWRFLATDLVGLIQSGTSDTSDTSDTFGQSNTSTLSANLETSNVPTKPSKPYRSADSAGTLHLYASGGLYGKNKTIDDLVIEMKSMHAAGFNIVKMKIGGLPIDEDLERINAVLYGLDTSCKLIIDGVYRYTTQQALTLYNALPAKRIEAFQSPIKADDLAGMKTLCDAGVPVMATEAEYRIEIHKQLVDTGAVKFLQTAPIACGGLTRLHELSNQVQNSDKPALQLSLEVSSTAVALLAAAHYAVAINASTCNRVAHVEYHYLHQVFFDRLKLKAVIDRSGWFHMPEEPGLGMDLPESETQMVFCSNIETKN